MADTEWEPYRQEIERLYCHENNTLDAVMVHMASTYAWQKLKGQYQRQLKKWGLKKYGPHVPHWPFIGRRMQKRKLYQQKESEVYLDGAQIPAKRLKKAMYREAHVKMEDLVPSAPSPATPDGVMVCTPVSPGMHVEWNMELPWLRFLNRINPGGAPGPASPSASLTASSPVKLSVSPPALNRTLMDHIKRVVPWNKLCQPPNIYSCSRLATALSIVMPEVSENQHDTLSSGLCHSNIGTKDRFHLELFLLSNNLMSNNPLASEKTMVSDSKHVIEMFNRSGWNNSHRVRLLLSTEEPTAEAIAERVFASAVRILDLKTAQIMLEAGIDSSVTVETIHDGPLTPLQFALGSESKESLELVKLLLQYKVDVNLSYNELPALGYAVEQENNDTITLLLEAGAKVTQSCLHPAMFARINYRELETLISACPDVNVPAEFQGRSLLVKAIYHGKVYMVRLLLARGADVREPSLIPIDGKLAITSVLGHASRVPGYQGSNMVKALLPVCGIINPKSDDLPVVSPLTLAVEAGSTEVAEILLRAGVSVEAADCEGGMTLLERAAKNKNKKNNNKTALCRLLIDAGARINRSPSDIGYKSSALLTAANLGSFEVVDLLINAGARLNDIYSQPPGTFLGAAIEQGNPSLIDRLMLANPRVANGKIRCIGNLSTAVRLEQYGILQTILETSGHSILKKALLNRENDLVQYLLHRGVDTLLRSQGQVNPPYEITALGLALRTHHPHKLAVANKLLSHGAKVSDEDLAYVVRTDNGELLRTVLAGFKGSGATAVASAIRRKQPLGSILAAGVNPTGTPQWRSTSWMDYKWHHQEVPNPPQSVLEVAVAYEIGDDELETLLGWADWDRKLTGRALAIAVLMGNNELAHRLIEYGADVNQETNLLHWCRIPWNSPLRGTFTPLRAAVKLQMVPLVKSLVQLADVNYLGRGRRTPLQHAVEQGNMEIINTLLDHGAKVDSPPASNGGATALQIAAIKGYIGIAQLLISLGADVNEPPARYYGSTALEGAAQYGRIDLLQMLLNKGALVVGDGEQQYKKAVELARLHGHMSAARLLKAFRASVEVNTPETAP